MIFTIDPRVAQTAGHDRRPQGRDPRVEPHHQRRVRRRPLDNRLPRRGRHQAHRGRQDPGRGPRAGGRRRPRRQVRLRWLGRHQRLGHGHREPSRRRADDRRRRLRDRSRPRGKWPTWSSPCPSGAGPSTTTRSPRTRRLSGRTCTTAAPTASWAAGRTGHPGPRSCRDPTGRSSPSAATATSCSTRTGASRRWRAWSSKSPSSARGWLSSGYTRTSSSRARSRTCSTRGPTASTSWSRVWSVSDIR